MNKLKSDYLRKIRNNIPINIVIADFLKLEWKSTKSYFKFICPLCKSYNTTVYCKTNLARCFECNKNYNTIDITMIVKRCNFLDAVHFLDNYLPKEIK